MVQISDLDFDLDMVVTLNQEAQTLLQRVEDASASVRLSLKLGKTKAVVYSQHPEIRTKCSDSIKIQLAVLNTWVHGSITLSKTWKHEKH